MMSDEDCMVIKYILVNMVCLWVVIAVICFSEFYSNDGLNHDICLTDKVNDEKNP